jgi:hypothetical protein
VVEQQVVEQVVEQQQVEQVVEWASVRRTCHAARCSPTLARHAGRYHQGRTSGRLHPFEHCVGVEDYINGVFGVIHRASARIASCTA